MGNDINTIFNCIINVLKVLWYTKFSSTVSTLSAGEEDIEFDMRSQIFILRSFILLKLYNVTCNPGAAARPRLESEAMCGVTTGGREECYWDCGLFNDPYLGVLITNPECLLDCYQPVSTEMRRIFNCDESK